jgi:hypothetical protein
VGETLGHVSCATSRTGEPDWSPERLQFDTVVDGRAQRALHNGAPRAFA